MVYKKLPAMLKPGDKIACRRVFDPPKVLEVLKVYDDGRVLVCRENGNRAYPPLAMETLRFYDYELVEK